MRFWPPSISFPVKPWIYQSHYNFAKVGDSLEKDFLESLFLKNTLVVHYSQLTNLPKRDSKNENVPWDTHKYQRNAKSLPKQAMGIAFSIFTHILIPLIELLVIYFSSSTQNKH